MGQTGPYAAHPGFGSQLSSLAGFSELIGRTDGPPLFIYGPFIDLIAVAFGGIAVLAALDHQRRTGEGAHIDLSQYEAGLQFVTVPLLEYAANGNVARRDGNRDPVAVPHGCYPCREGRWCVISCWDDEEWQRFGRAAGRPAWCQDPRFSTASERRKHETELNDLMSQWTREKDAEELMYRLQKSRVHAAAVRSMRELFSDPQIASRQIWQKQRHPEMGDHHYRMGSFQLTETPGRVRKPAPCLGEHNEEIFCGWLGLDPDQYKELLREGVFS
jgi:crotonobetainyl-CoA:carnitine CoA-transferase CaiB-like acyl-CoA transferase